MTTTLRIRRAAAVLVTTLAVGTAMAATATTADAATASKITVAASDTSVSSGEQLVLSGRLSHGGTVKVASLEGSTWKPLSGAVVHTRKDGTYRVRVVLSRKGDRTLRVVGDPDAAGVTNSRAKVSISVR